MMADRVVTWAAGKIPLLQCPKRDNYHVEVFDCSEVTSSGRQVIRVFCSNGGEESDSSLSLKEDLGGNGLVVSTTMPL